MKAWGITDIGLVRKENQDAYLIREETPQGIACALRETLARSDEALLEQGMAARSFVLTQKDNVTQASKILEMLNRMQRK